MTNRTLYLRLLGYVRPHWRVFAAALLTMVAVAATEPVLPALMKPMLDGSFVDKDPAVIRWIPFALVALFVVRGLAMFASGYTMAWVGHRVVMDLRRAMFDKLITQPSDFYDHATKGRLVASAAYNVTQVTDSATTVLTALVRDTLSIVGLVGWLFWLNWKLSLVTLAILPPALWVFRVASRRLRHTSREIQRNLGDITHVLEESIAGHKIIKVFGGQDYERGRFGEASGRARRFAMKQTAASQAHGPILQLLAALALAVIVYMATLQATANETTVGGFVSYMVAMLMLSAPLKRLSGVTVSLQRGLAAAEEVFALIDRPGEQDSGTLDIGRAQGALRFDGVALTYSGKWRPALAGVDLTVAAGETVALVGASGSGKTSLVNLLPRFYTPSAGRILLDGTDIRDIRLACLRANLALVSQEITLFNDSVAANIAYGHQGEADEARLRQAAEAALAWDFIRELPEGLATTVGENGVRLSGGQRQRLAIARALFKDAPILILDEATSALDTESERLIQAALENLMRGRTTLVIAHRLSTIERADRIVVMDRGRIVEQGRHADLMAANGVYARLHALQFGDAAGQEA
ncbi:MAG TPA: lipid A export permease/ATP-binding protein MsbA [Thiobacillaceae bacterium]|nr:lipid A export permease/ATP-binding protein MsbA [Thiobacillaceae bacterium]